MYSVEIRDHVMIAHSLCGESFGPAQRLHGATYVIDISFMSRELDDNDVVVDIGRAGEVTRETLAALNYRNLDEHPDFAGRRSTTETVARWIFDRIREAILRGDFGAGGAALERVRVTLHESHVARASYEGEVGRA